MTLINPNTGSIGLSGYRHRIKPGMKLDEFLASSLAADAHADRMGKRHIWYRYRPLSLGGTLFHVSVLFTGSVIDCVSMCCSDGRYGKSWEEWSEKKELKPGPIRHKNLSDYVLEKSAAVYDVLGPYLNTTLELA